MKSLPLIAMASVCMMAVTFTSPAMADVATGVLQAYVLSIPAFSNVTIPIPANFTTSFNETTPNFGGVTKPAIMVGPDHAAPAVEATAQRVGRALDLASRCQATDILNGQSCIVSNCGKYRKLECNAVSDMDLKNCFATYNDAIKMKNATVPGPVLPLFVKLNGGSLNISRALFSTVAGQIGKLELNQVSVSTVPEDTFADFATLTGLTFNGVIVDKIPGGLFQGLGDTLQSLTLKNLTTLATVQPNAFDPLIASKSLHCIDFDLRSPKYSCDCLNGSSSTAGIQRSLTNISQSTTGNISMTWQDMYADMDNGPVKVASCDIQFICSNSSSAADFRLKNVRDLDVKVCAPPPTAPPTTVAVTTAAPRPTTVDAKGGASRVGFYGWYALLGFSALLAFV